MITIKGSFKDLYEHTVSVEIVNTSVSADSTVEIEDNGLIYFDGDSPIEIEDNMDDIMTVIGMTSASINFKTKNYVGDLFYGNNDKAVTVLIKRDEKVIFDGYVDPVQYNQDYNSWFDNFTLNCIDKLSTLQYHKYKEVNADTYDEKKIESEYITFQDALILMLPDYTNAWFDASVELPGLTASHVFDNLKVSEQIFFGDDYDSVWTYDTVLEEILRYLNLHIRQVGSDYYIYNWATCSNGSHEWVNAVTYEKKTLTPSTINITAEKHASDDTNITIGESYNQVQVTCDLDSQDTIVESPLDSSNIRSLFTNKQKYMTEYIAEGEGSDAFNSFKAMLLGNRYQPDDGYSGAKYVDWYMQALYNKNWKLYSEQGEVNSLYDQDENGVYINQWKLSARMKEKPIEPALIALGSVEYEGGIVTDNSNKSKISMSNYLAISLNGNAKDDDTHLPSTEQIKRRTPLAEYISSNSASILSPVDDLTTNYLLITGKICLMPIQKETDTYAKLLASAQNKVGHHWEYPILYHYDDDGNYVPWLDPDGNEQYDYDAEPTLVTDDDSVDWNTYWHKIVPSDNNGDGRYYTRKWYANKYCGVKATSSTTLVDYGLQPMTDDKSNHDLKYESSTKGEKSDTLSHVDVLDCELIVGDKRCIWYNEQFQWVKLGEEPTETDSDGSVVSVTTFPISFNPAKDDYMIGDEFDITNTLTVEDNTDSEGTAIPIKASDNLSGKIIFRIVGVINNQYEFDHQHNHRQWLFWHCYDWDESKYKYVVSHAESILIKDFKIEMISDNADQSTEYSDTDNELVYVSLENDNYININDDTTFKLITQPSTIECLEKGIPTDVNINAVLYQDGSFVREITNMIYAESAKPEEHYVNQYYLMQNKPHIQIETTVFDDDDIDYNNIYYYPPLNRKFQVISISRNLGDHTATLTLREID